MQLLLVIRIILELWFLWLALNLADCFPHGTLPYFICCEHYSPIHSSNSPSYYSWDSHGCIVLWRHFQRVITDEFPEQNQSNLWGIAQSSRSWTTSRFPIGWLDSKNLSCDSFLRYSHDRSLILLCDPANAKLQLGLKRLPDFWPVNPVM